LKVIPMRSRLKFIFVLIALCLLFISTDIPAMPSDTASFTLVRQNSGIALYERWYPIGSGQQAREIKAIFRVAAQPAAAAALIKDESKGKQWNKNTLSYEVIPENHNMWFGYIQYDLPWPLSDQDCVLQYNQNYSGDTLKIVFAGSRHPAFPERKRIQRIPEISGRWIFRQVDSGIIVEYYITTTPSTTLPAWVTDPIIRNNLIETLQVFRDILEK